MTPKAKPLTPRDRQVAAEVLARAAVCDAALAIPEYQWAEIVADGEESARIGALNVAVAALRALTPQPLPEPDAMTPTGTPALYPPWVAVWAARPLLKDDARRQRDRADDRRDTWAVVCWTEVLRRMEGGDRDAPVAPPPRTP